MADADERADEPVGDLADDAADEAADVRAEPDGPPPGLITVRGAAVGVALLWLAAMAGFGTLQASMYAARVAPEYAAVAVGAAAVSLAAGYGSLRSFGLA